MLFLHEDEQVSRWGRAFERGPGRRDPDAFGVRTGAVRANAGAIGGVVTALAIVVPARDPDAGRPPLRLRARVGRRRRHRPREPDGRPAPRPDPRARTSTWCRSSPTTRTRRTCGSPCSTGSPARSGAPGTATCRATTWPAATCRPSEGVDPSVVRQEFDYAVSGDRPVPVDVAARPRRSISRIEAPGDWRYDLDTRGLPRQRRRPGHRRAWSGTFTAVELGLDADELALARVPRPGWSATSSPTCRPGIDARSAQLALEVTEDAPSRFEKARRAAELVPGGRRLRPTTTAREPEQRGRRPGDVPARGRRGRPHRLLRAVRRLDGGDGPDPRHPGPGRGRLPRPDQVGAEHLRLQRPRPARLARALLRRVPAGCASSPPRAAAPTTVPDYTTQPINLPTSPTRRPTRPRRTSTTRPPAPPRSPRPATDRGDRRRRRRVLRPVGPAARRAGRARAAGAPGRSRPRRCAAGAASGGSAGGPEDAWVELRDTVRDLGLLWPRDRSPRQTARGPGALVRRAARASSPPSARAAGPTINPDAVVAIDRIVPALELSRYAEREPGPDGSWPAEVETCVARPDRRVDAPGPPPGRVVAAVAVRPGRAVGPARRRRRGRPTSRRYDRVRRPRRLRRVDAGCVRVSVDARVQRLAGSEAARSRRRRQRSSIRSMKEPEEPARRAARRTLARAGRCGRRRRR